MDKKVIEIFISEIDSVLQHIGFKYVKTRNVWERKVGNTDIEWVHFNYGLSVINISLGVKYKDLSDIISSDIVCVSGVACMLSKITNEMYTESTKPQYLADTISQFAPAQLAKLRDRYWVIERLKDENVNNWPVLSMSHRIRLLPLLLAKHVSLDETLKYLAYFDTEFSVKDQLIPKYSIFKNSLIEHLNA